MSNKTSVFSCSVPYFTQLNTDAAPIKKVSVFLIIVQRSYRIFKSAIRMLLPDNFYHRFRPNSSLYLLHVTLTWIRRHLALIRYVAYWLDRYLSMNAEKQNYKRQLLARFVPISIFLALVPASVPFFFPGRPVLTNFTRAGGKKRVSHFAHSQSCLTQNAAINSINTVQ